MADGDGEDMLSSVVEDVERGCLRRGWGRSGGGMEDGGGDWEERTGCWRMAVCLPSGVFASCDSL